MNLTILVSSLWPPFGSDPEPPAPAPPATNVDKWWGGHFARHLWWGTWFMGYVPIDQGAGPSRFYASVITTGDWMHTRVTDA